jgi:ribosome-binding protein aMBF1 (putative translation factor)
MRKLEQADGPQKVKHLSSESKQLIVARRVANGWNQQQQNQQCGFPLHTIRDIENGKLTPTPGQLNVLNRVLKAGLKYASS